MLPEHIRQIIEPAETAACEGQSLTEVLPILRRLSLDDFGLVLWSMPSAEFPGLSSVLPRMTPASVQTHWTGSAGVDLLRGSTWFPRLMDAVAGLQGKRVLDIGCGYGRLIRLMYYYTNPPNIVGVDPWPKSLEHVQGLPGTFLQSDPLPSRFDVPPVDVAYAFSVFTHLPDYAITAVLGATHKALNPGGYLFASFRPVEHWRQVAGDTEPEMREHREKGIAHRPHEGKEHYGDTSISLDWFRRLPDWEVERYERSLTSAAHLIAVLRPN